MLRHVQPTFRGEFLPAFRYQGNQVGFNIQGDFGHGVFRGHFQVEVGLNGFAQNGQVTILNMPPVFPEVDDNSIRPGDMNQRGCDNGIRFMPPTSLAERGDMIDFDVDTGMRNSLLNE